MQSNTVAKVLELYNILSCGKADEAKYKETLFFKNVTKDSKALIDILNGESPAKVMKITSNNQGQTGKPITSAPVSVDLSKKFGFFEGSKKVYELFGHALRRIVDTYGSEASFKEEEMFIQPGEEIKEKDYTTITTFFNLRTKTGTTYDQNLLNQEISARDIYLHIYAGEHKSFPVIIEEAQKLSDVEPKLVIANGEITSLKKEKEELLKKIGDFKPELEKKYNAFVNAINDQQTALDKNQTIYFNDLEKAKTAYESACKTALTNKGNNDTSTKSEHKGKINAAKSELVQCINKLMTECGINKK